MGLEIEYIDKNLLRPYINNAKIHTGEQIERIRRSIEQFGFNDPIAVWKDNEIIEGHGRLQAAMQMDSIDTVPVIRLDKLTDDERKAYTLVHNKLTMDTDFDGRLLDIELDNFRDFDTDIDMSDFGFDLFGEEAEKKHQKNKEDTDRRNSDFLNSELGIFDGEGQWDIPTILPVYELPEIKQWIGFNYVLSDDDPTGKAVHFFMDDYQFERLWGNPKQYVGKLRQYVCVCSPDFSPMPHMPYICQVFNHYRKHWVARFLQENGVVVIPTVRAASDEKSFEYCFDGEPTRSIVMYSAQWTRSKGNREISQKEYDEMLKRLDPIKIFVYQDGDKEWLDFRGRNIEKVKAFNRPYWRKRNG